MGQSPRYFVIYKHWQNGEIVQSHSCLGRFASADAAVAAAHAYNRPGLEVVDLRVETKFQAARHAAWLLIEPVLFAIIRVIRVCAGAGIALVAFQILIVDGHIGDIPISQLTLSMIVDALFKGVVLLAIGWICFWLAFGPSGRMEK